jgi:hypothetical protein
LEALGVVALAGAVVLVLAQEVAAMVVQEVKGVKAVQVEKAAREGFWHNRC